MNRCSNIIGGRRDVKETTSRKGHEAVDRRMKGNLLNCKSKASEAGQFEESAKARA